jgi:hypothetical protein
MMAETVVPNVQLLGPGGPEKSSEDEQHDDNKEDEAYDCRQCCQPAGMPNGYGRVGELARQLAERVSGQFEPDEPGGRPESHLDAN